MNRREYLESQGFKCGARGRFSADMLAALDNARKDGVEFSDEKPKVKEKKDLIVMSPVPSPPRRRPVRNNDNWFLISDDGTMRVAFDNCRSCAQHIIWCECKNGPTPPNMFGPNAKVIIEEKEMVDRTRQMV